ncbi:MAG: hypothetical protein WCO38_06320 [Verrucomicrobiota bacterium]|jgi:hypothetical protein|nr:MAG: hypothetical protein DVB35_02975 [Verrucomicrobiota bacterium]
MAHRVKLGIAFCVVFAAGVAIGSVSTLRYTRPVPVQGVDSPPEKFSVQLLQRWIKLNQFKLTPDQFQKINPIIRDTAEDLRRLRSENLNSEQIILEHMQDEVADQLEPKQKKTFQDLMDRQRRMMDQFIEKQRLKALDQKAKLEASQPVS